MENNIEFQLSEREIRKMLSLEGEEKLKFSPSSLFRYFLIFLAFFLISFAIINAPALYQRLKYFWFVEYQNKNLPPAKTESEASKSLPQVSPESEVTPQTISDNTLSIPKIGVFAPVIWNVKETEIMDKLRQGVTQLKGTALPNTSSNVFITGHSSNYWWDKGKYKQVFSLLDKLVVGDEISLIFEGKEYRYIVKDVKVVKPTQVEIKNPTTSSTLTLMTCTPVGTTLNRLVVSAELQNPQIQNTKPSNLVPELPFLSN